MRNIAGALRLLVPVLLLGLYVAWQLHERHEAAGALRDETLASAVPTVAVTQAEPGAATATIDLPGNIEAWYQAPIYAQVSGYVKMWYKDYGAEVKTGDVLAEINTPALDAQYAQAKADMEAVRARYNLAVVTAERYSALRKSQAVSEQSITVQEANARAEEATLRAAEQNVNNFLARIRFKTIVAPYDGVITERNINVGEYINSEGNISDKRSVTNLFSVADIHKLRLFVSVPETFANVLKPGLTATFTLPQFGERRYTAQFLTVAKGFDQNTRTVVTEFSVDNQARQIWPGSYAQVRLTMPADARVLVIPSSAMVFEEKGTQVATVTADNRIHFKPINVGKILDGTVEVLGGLARTDRIVDNPGAFLLEGDPVRIVKPARGYGLAASEPAPSKAAADRNAARNP